MAKYVSSTLGNITPNVSGGYTQNPGYSGGPFDIGSIVCGSDNIEISQKRESGSNTIVIKKNGVESTTFPNGNMDISGYVGFYATLNGTEVKVYYIWTDGSPETNVDGQTTITAQGGLNYSYGATLLGTYTTSILLTEWDDPNYVDPDYDPNVPQGGENADIDPITTDDVNNFLDSLPFDPEEALTSHQNIRMMQPYLLSASDWLTMGELFWKDANTSGSFFQQLKELFSNGATDPLSAIAGFIRLPLNKSAIKRNGSGNVYLGGVELTDGTKHVVGEYISNRYASLTYSLQIKETFGTYFDYTRTKVQAYLPYCGQVDLNASEIMAGTLDAQYIVDVYTGDLLCTLNLRKNMYGTSLKSVIGRWKGNCAMPVLYARGNTQQHTQNVFNGALSYAGSIASGNVLSGIGTLGGMLSDQRIRTEKGGSLSGASGWFDTQFPYLIITRDVPLYPDNFMEIEGAEQNATFTVSSLSGFTKFDSIHVELANASDEENAEIESYLKNGIIL